MDYKEWHTDAKTDWPDGPWKTEPDKVQFITKVGLPALIVRNRGGALCGYVGVGPGHPFYEKDYSAIVQLPPNRNRICTGAFSENIAILTGDADYTSTVDGHLTVHGGITYTDHSQEYSKARWKRYQDRMIRILPDVEKYPNGDATRIWEEAEDNNLMNSYEAWVKWEEARAISPVPSLHLDVWWLGFDCAHAGDYMPAFDAILGKIPQLQSSNIFKDGEYRDINYVEDQIEMLAEQLMQLNKKIVKQLSLLEDLNG